MNLFKRCDCAKPATCRHPFGMNFGFDASITATTHTANRRLARQIAEKAHVRALETREGLRPPKPVRLAAGIPSSELIAMLSDFIRRPQQ
jgi:hypothetical protein